MTHHTLVAPDAVTTRSVGPFADQLKAAQAGNDAVTIDLSATVDADLSLIQLIEIVRRDAARNGRELRLRHPAGDAVAALLRRAGFLTRPVPADLDFWFHGDSPQ